MTYKFLEALVLYNVSNTISAAVAIAVGCQPPYRKTSIKNEIEETILCISGTC